MAGKLSSSCGASGLSDIFYPFILMAFKNRGNESLYLRIIVAKYFKEVL
jgi:hypothetical protein